MVQMGTMEWIYLSPHADDVALSCGGLVWEQASAGEKVTVWTICAGDPPDPPFSPFAEMLHRRWQTGPDAVQHRRQEDCQSCARMGASVEQFSLPDCIYRQDAEKTFFLYAAEEAILGPIHPAEAPLVETLRAEIERRIPPQASLVCPMSLGGHVDHRLTFAAASRYSGNLWFYADFPYILRAREQLAEKEAAGWRKTVFSVSSAGLSAWQDAVAAHASQISTFWPDLDAMGLALRQYCNEAGGIPLWQASS